MPCGYVGSDGKGGFFIRPAARLPLKIMAVGKNKRLTKGGKKGGKKKAGDPFLRKEWYDIKAPSMFSVRNCGKTLVSRTQGTKIATEELKGRVLEVWIRVLGASNSKNLRDSENQ